MRYKGQAFELTVPAPHLARLMRPCWTSLIAGFHDIHRQRFSYANPGSPVRVRVAARVGHRSAADVGGKAARRCTASASRRGTQGLDRQVRWREIAAWSRGQITLDVPLKGPAVIEEAYTTVLLADGWNCRRDKSGHLIAERSLA